MAEIKDSTRSKAQERTIVLDEATRKKRQRKALEALEKDNFQDELPGKGMQLSDSRLQLNKKFQQRFTLQEDDPLSASSTSMLVSEDGRKRRVKIDSKLRLRKNFATMFEEEQAASLSKKYSYFSICAGPSSYPKRKFCAVCGFQSAYNCTQCGTKYCSIKCLHIHKDTRCLKWIV